MGGGRLALPLRRVDLGVGLEGVVGALSICCDAIPSTTTPVLHEPMTGVLEYIDSQMNQWTRHRSLLSYLTISQGY